MRRLAAFAVLPVILLAGCSAEDLPALPDVPDLPEVDAKAAWVAAVDAAGITSAVDRSTEALYESAQQLCDKAKNRDDVRDWAVAALEAPVGQDALRAGDVDLAAEAFTEATWTLVC